MNLAKSLNSHQKTALVCLPPSPISPHLPSFRSMKALSPSMALCVPEAATALDNETTPTRLPRLPVGEVGGEGSANFEREVSWLRLAVQHIFWVVIFMGLDGIW